MWVVLSVQPAKSRRGEKLSFAEMVARAKELEDELAGYEFAITGRDPRKVLPLLLMFK